VSFGARAVIRLAAIRNNLAIIRNLTGAARIVAVIKANAYGHGLVAVARQLPTADSFAVARLSEAVRLREAGIEQPVILLEGAFTPRELDESLARKLELVVHCEAQLAMLEARQRGDAVVWLKVDTGMHRLGFEAREVARLQARLARCPAVREVRLMTHLANADDRGDERTKLQIDRFAALLDSFDGDFSIANSAGILGWPEAISGTAEASRSWVRAGIALYGVSPFRGTVGAEFGLQAAMNLEARIIAVKAIGKGVAVGYGGYWRAPRDTVLGIVSAGYGDGYSRFLPSGTPVLVNGREAALAGRISMDTAAIDLGPDSKDAVGDSITLWGEALPVEKVAACAGTIPYTLLAGVMHRDPPLNIA
jgi:alanine racemase